LIKPALLGFAEPPPDTVGLPPSSNEAGGAASPGFGFGGSEPEPMLMLLGASDAPLMQPVRDRSQRVMHPAYAALPSVAMSIAAHSPKQFSAVFSHCCIVAADAVAAATVTAARSRLVSKDSRIIDTSVGGATPARKCASVMCFQRAHTSAVRYALELNVTGKCDEIADRPPAKDSPAKASLTELFNLRLSTKESDLFVAGTARLEFP
jgi:hypothetical protein